MNDRRMTLIADAIGSGPFPATRTRACQWALEGPDGCRPTLSFDDPWLAVEAPVAGRRENTWWELLIRTPAMDGRSLVAAPGNSGVSYRSELWLGAHVGDQIESRIRGIEEGFFDTAIHRAGASPPPERLQATCREAGLECDPDHSVPEWAYLPGYAHEHRAWIQLTPGGLRISVDVVRVDSLAPFEPREATALLVFTVAGMLRLVSVEAAGDEDAFRVRFVAQLPPDPDACELAHALGALSSAMRLARSEAEALADEPVARAYLAVRDSQDRTANEEPNPLHNEKE